MPHLQLFPTPVSMYDLPDMDDVNRQITKILTAESRSVPSVHRSNVGSWHSGNLAGRTEPAFRKLFEKMIFHVRETVHTIAKEETRSVPNMRIGIHAWAMVMYNGHYTVPHNHSDAHWACVYYPDAGDADQEGAPASGLLALVDPRQGGRTTPGLDYVGTTFTVVPKTGHLVVFPAWLLHYVHTYLGKRPRISIACNIVLEAAAPIATNRQVQGVTP